MSLRTAVLLLRLPLGPGSRLSRWAGEAVLRAANRGEPAGVRAAASLLEARGAEAVFRLWLKPSVSGPAPRRWASPLVADRLPYSSRHVPDTVVEAAWRDWLDAHDDTLWSLLERWGPAPLTSARELPALPALSALALGRDGELCAEAEGTGVSVPADVLAATAARFGHPVGERARARLLTAGDAEAVELFCAAAPDSPEAVAFCTAHHLAPADETRRAVFFVRTGQDEQYRALDPGGELLALGYRGATAEERAALRLAMSESGILDTVRVLAGQRSPQEDFASLSVQERAYLVRQLLDREEWDRLWRLTLLMPLADALETVEQFGDWRPSGEEDRRVFEELREADLTAFTGFMAGMSVDEELPHQFPRTRIWLSDDDERQIGVHALDFSPDGTQLAFTGFGPGHCAGVVDLGSLTLEWLDTSLPHAAKRVAHLGSGTVVAAGRKEVHYAVDGSVRTLDTALSDVRGLERVDGDRAFALTARDRTPGASHAWTLFTDGLDGPRGADTDDPDVLLSGSGLLRDHGLITPRVTTVAPDGRRLAVLGEDTAVVGDLAETDGRRLASPGSHKYGVQHAALSPSVLLCSTNSGALHVWHDPFAATTTEPPVTIRAWSYQSMPVCLAWSPVLDRFVAVAQSRLQLLDVPPPGETCPPEDLVAGTVLLDDGAYAKPRSARTSRRGDLLAAAGFGKGTVDLYVLPLIALRPLVARPMGALGHSELAEVVAVLEHPLLDEESRHTLGLLRTCLEHRFRHDVGIGAVAGAASFPGHDDIALGEAGAP